MHTVLLTCLLCNARLGEKFYEHNRPRISGTGPRLRCRPHSRPQRFRTKTKEQTDIAALKALLANCSFVVGNQLPRARALGKVS